VARAFVTASVVSESIVEIRGGRVRVGIDPVGAGIQALEVDGVAVVESYEHHGDDGGAPAASGATMFPWPNRVRDARWVWNGEVQQLTVSEPERNTANHGLVRTRAFDVTDHTAESATLSTLVDGEPGYPFSVRLDVTFTVLNDGLAISYRVTNEGNRAAPIALGAHPYVRVGTADTADLTLQLPAASVLDMDDRYLPVARRTVVGTPDDPRNMTIGSRALNDCYGDLSTDAAGDVACRVVAPDGTAVELRADGRFRWMQVYTTTEFVREGELVRAIAVEPMTAPPDALNSREDLAWVEPRTSWEASWSIRRVDSGAGRTH
jgi:aldose 1-epimerase